MGRNQKIRAIRSALKQPGRKISDYGGDAVFPIAEGFWDKSEFFRIDPFNQIEPGRLQYAAAFMPSKFNKDFDRILEIQSRENIIKIFKDLCEKNGKGWFLQMYDEPRRLTTASLIPMASLDLSDTMNCFGFSGSVGKMISSIMQQCVSRLEAGDFFVPIYSTTTNDYEGACIYLV